MKPQTLPEHEAVALATLVVHLVPQAPQLLRSFVSSTQDPLQLDSEPGHVATQADWEQ